MSAARSEIDSLLMSASIFKNYGSPSINHADIEANQVTRLTILERLYSSESSINDLLRAIHVLETDQHRKLGILKFIPSALSPIWLTLLGLAFIANISYLIGDYIDYRIQYKKNNDDNESKYEEKIIAAFNTKPISEGDYFCGHFFHYNTTCGALWTPRNITSLCHWDIFRNNTQCINVIANLYLEYNQLNRSSVKSYCDLDKTISRFLCNTGYLVKYYCKPTCEKEFPTLQAAYPLNILAITIGVTILVYILLAFLSKIMLGRNYVTNDATSSLENDNVKKMITAYQLHTNRYTTNTSLLIRLEKILDDESLTRHHLVNIFDNAVDGSYIDSLRSGKHNPHVKNAPTGHDVIDNYLVPYIFNDRPTHWNRERLFACKMRNLTNDTVVDSALRGMKLG